MKSFVFALLAVSTFAQTPTTTSLDFNREGEDDIPDFNSLFDGAEEGMLISPNPMANGGDDKPMDMEKMNRALNLLVEAVDLICEDFVMGMDDMEVDMEDMAKPVETEMAMAMEDIEKASGEMWEATNGEWDMGMDDDMMEMDPAMACQHATAMLGQVRDYINADEQGKADMEQEFENMIRDSIEELFADMGATQTTTFAAAVAAVVALLSF